MYLNSIGRYDDRIRNLYFIYAAVAKAIFRAEKILSSYNYDTDLDPVMDEESAKLVNELLHVLKTS